MPTIRDDSAGSYGTWDNNDLSWLDFLTAKASDGGNALANLGRNLAQGFSPIGTSEQGNMALQVPPIVSGIAQSYSNLAGSPSHPGNAYDLTGVPELDAPIQQDMSNVLLSLYGGNALNPLRGRAGSAISPDLAIAQAAERTFPNSLSVVDNPELIDLLNKAASGFQRSRADKQAIASHEHLIGKMEDVLADRNSFNDGSIPEQALSPYEIGQFNQQIRQRKINDGTLFSDTGKPSILGSAMAGAGENIGPLDYAKAAYKHLRYPTETVSPSDMKMWSNLAEMQQRVRSGDQSIAAHGHLIDKNKEHILASIGDQPSVFNDGLIPEQALSPYEIGQFNQQIRQRKINDGTLYSRPAPLPYQDDDLPPWLNF